MTESLFVLVGTAKGVFILEAESGREDWQLRGPFCRGWPINHVIGDPETGQLWAAGGNEWYGAGVWRSDDRGANWRLTMFANGNADAWLAENPETAAQLGLAPSPPAPFTGDVTALWSLEHVGGTLFAGAKPAALFASADCGQTWRKVPGLSEHPSRGRWQPGAAGLTLHSITGDPANPAKLWVGISAAGVFATEDGGTTWERRNRLSNASVAAAASESVDQEVGACVHNLRRAAGEGDVLYQQNHEGTFRSRDGGRSWQEITVGLPSNFGFPIAVHPRDPRTIWVLPLNGDMAGRYPPNASAAVWQSRDGGESWSEWNRGLPIENCFFTVLRQAMATDRATPVGVYFGTNSGSIFASADEGESWTEIARHLPTVLSVETLHGP